MLLLCVSNYAGSAPSHLAAAAAGRRRVSHGRQPAGAAAPGGRARFALGAGAARWHRRGQPPRLPHDAGALHAAAYPWCVLTLPRCRLTLPRCMITLPKVYVNPTLVCVNPSQV
jgi:hypothetical protein